MSHPHSTSIPPSNGGQTKTLFCIHGNAVAVIVTDSVDGMKSRKHKFRDAHAALDWCIANEANMTFTWPRDVSKN